LSGTNGIPKRLFGFDVVERLGEGAASTIYAVSDRADGQLYALKHVIRKNDKDIRFIHQLQNEFAVSRLFRHPGLRRYVAVKLHRSLMFKVKEAALVMELVDGISLDKHCPKEIPALLAIFEQVAKALSGLHYLDYVHCDLKPNNILVNAEGQVKLIDFGQACKIGTIKQRIQGTADFISPEQVKLQPVMVQTDVYGFGANLYWALTGQSVPTLYTVSRSQRDIVKEMKFPAPMDLRPDVPKPLSDMVMSCLKMLPLRRPENMEQIVTVLRAARGEQTEAARS
jgi:serine/threonine-protein kinase